VLSETPRWRLTRPEARSGRGQGQFLEPIAVRREALGVAAVAAEDETPQFALPPAPGVLRGAEAEIE
jgi:hypothetical protein